MLDYFQYELDHLEDLLVIGGFILIIVTIVVSLDLLSPDD